MELLFATGNPAKVKSIAKKINDTSIRITSLKDLGLELNVDENGKNSVENAIIKAKAAYQLSKKVSFGMDNSLYIKELPEDKQPGTHVRRINGKILNDEEMISHYRGLVKEYGKLTCTWVYGLAIYDGEHLDVHSWNLEDFYFIDDVSVNLNPGYPLDSISLIPRFNKYLVDLSKEEREKMKEFEPPDGVSEFVHNYIEKYLQK